MNIEILLGELLKDDRIYATSMPEIAVERQFEFLERSVTLWSIRTYFFKMLVNDDPMHPLFENYEKQDEYFNNNIIRRARHMYEKDVRAQERLVSESNAVSTKDITERKF